MRKRVWTSIALATILAACSGSSPGATPLPDSSSAVAGSASPAAQSEQPSSSAGEAITLDFPTWQASEPGSGDFWKAVIAEYEKQNPNVKVNLTLDPFADHTNNLVKQFTAQDPPEIVHMQSPDVPNFADKGWLANMDACLDEADIVSNWTDLQSQLTLDGKYYGLVLFTFPWVLYYNEKLLNEKGIAPPKTLTEFLDAIKAFDGGDSFGYVTATSSDPNTFAQSNAWVVGNGGSYVTNGEASANSASTISGMDAYRAAAKNAPQGMDANKAREAFMQGKVAFYIDGAFFNGFLDKDAPADLRPSLKVAQTPFPTITGSVSNNLAIPAAASPDKQAAVCKFIQLVATPEWQEKYQELLKVPVPRKGVASPTASETVAFFNDLNEKAVGTVPTDKAVRLNFGAYQQAVIDAMTALTTSDTPTVDIAGDLQSKISDILAE